MPFDVSTLLFQPGIDAESTVARLVLAVVLGGVIGLERGRKNQAAGFRTHILIALGSCIVTMMGSFFALGDGKLIDPTRMAAQVVSGIGFLGAGAIFRYGVDVKGLTTAASLWSVAAIGLAVGAGMYFRRESLVFEKVSVSRNGDDGDSSFSCHFKAPMAFDAESFLDEITALAGLRNVSLDAVT